MTGSDAHVPIPTHLDLLFPTLRALDVMGGEAANADLDEKAIELAGLSDHQLAVEFPDESGHSGSKVRARLSWARSSLNTMGLIGPNRGGRREITDEGRAFLAEGDEAALKQRELESRSGLTVDLDRLVAEVAENDAVPITVRDLLSEWGVARRGSAVTATVKRDLARHGLTTEPPFDEVSLDQSVELKREAVPVREPEVRAATAEVPTVTIGTLRSAGAGVVDVSPNAPILEVQSLMERHDYSQLPVLNGPRELKGAISWESIARATLYGAPPKVAQDALDRSAVVVDQSAPLLEHIHTIADAGFVFVRDRTRVITGIVTASDLSYEFQKQAKPFLLLGEIENWLRAVVDAVFSSEDLVEYVDPTDTSREIEAAENLTFGEYVRLFEDPVAWEKAGLRSDRKVFCAHLDDVRRIRNSIMHFSPDPIADADLEAIERLLRWLRRLTKTAFGSEGES